MLRLTHRDHHERAGASRSGVVEHAAAAIVVLAVLVAGVLAWGAVGLAIAVALVPAALAALADRRTGRLPDPLVGATLVSALAIAVGLAVADRFSPGVAAGAVVMALPLLAMHLASPAAMGFGDVKLAAALGALIGVIDARAVLATLALASGGAVAVALVRRRSALAFGPALVAATGAVLVPLATFGWEAPRWR